MSKRKPGVDLPPVTDLARLEDMLSEAAADPASAAPPPSSTIDRMAAARAARAGQPRINPPAYWIVGENRSNRSLAVLHVAKSARAARKMMTAMSMAFNAGFDGVRIVKVKNVADPQSVNGSQGG